MITILFFVESWICQYIGWEKILTDQTHLLWLLIFFHYKCDMFPPRDKLIQIHKLHWIFTSVLQGCSYMHVFNFILSYVPFIIILSYKFSHLCYIINLFRWVFSAFGVVKVLVSSPKLNWLNKVDAEINFKFVLLGI